jgi:hypothetical protein
MMDEKTTVSAATDGQPSQAVYLYGLIRTGTVVDLPAVELLVVGDVAAAFERVSAVEWSGPAAEANLQDSAWLVSHACRHGEVVSALNARSAVLPVRFGAIFTSERVLEEFLETHVNEIIPFLERIDGHEEWSLKFFLQADQASAWLLAMDPELSLRQQSLSETPGKRYFQEKQLLAAVKKKGATIRTKSGSTDHRSIVSARKGLSSTPIAGLGQSRVRDDRTRGLAVARGERADVLRSDSASAGRGCRTGVGDRMERPVAAI